MQIKKNWRLSLLPIKKHKLPENRMFSLIQINQQ